MDVWRNEGYKCRREEGGTVINAGNMINTQLYFIMKYSCVFKKIIII